MKLHFDSKQKFQLEAVKARADIFIDQLKTNAGLQMKDAEIDFKTI